MDLSYSEFQELLKNTARDFAQREFPISRYRELIERHDVVGRDIFQKMASLQWTGLLVDEAYGGTGGGWVDLVVLLEEMGRALTPMTLMPHLLASLVLQAFGTDEQKRALLPLLVHGQRICAPAIVEPNATFEGGRTACTATPDADGYILGGTKAFVRGGTAADLYIVLARLGDAAGLFLVDAQAAGVRVTPLDNIGDDDQATIELEQVRVSAGSLIGGQAQPWSVVGHIIDRGALMEAGYGIGVMARDTEMTIDYVKDRIQFSRPLGSFQAVQHQVADQVTDVDCGRYLTLYAAWALDGRRADAETAIARAKAWVSDALRRVVRTGNQLHGGIGFSREYDIHLYYQRAKTCELMFGHADAHRERVAAALLDG